MTQTSEVGRQFRPELGYFAARWVFDRQNMGMQRLSGKICEGCTGFRRQKGRFGAESGPINLVSQQWMADRGQMDPNLVGPAGFKAA